MTSERSRPAPFELDTRRVRRSFEIASATYDEAAVLQDQVRARMLERLDLVRLNPGRILDAGSGTGLGAAALARRRQSHRAGFCPRDVARGARTATSVAALGDGLR